MKAKVTDCKHGKHAPEHLIAALPEAQGNVARHKCAVCAYQAGARAALEALSIALLEAIAAYSETK